MATAIDGRPWRRKGEEKMGRKVKKPCGDELARKKWVAKQKGGGDGTGVVALSSPTSIFLFLKKI